MLEIAIETLARIDSDDKRHYQYGEYALFLRLNDDWGVKLYCRESKRDEAWAEQKRVARHKLAPKVGERFYFQFSNGNAYYGYITECVVETWEEAQAKFLYHLPVADLTEDEVNFIESMWDDDSQGHKLIDKLEDLDCITYDLHCGNVGFMKDGRLVMIDFA
jgi:hypothetical protein